MRDLAKLLDVNETKIAAKRFKVEVSPRHWKRYDHKKERYTHMCPITLLVLTTTDPKWSPSSGEPGEDHFYAAEAAKMLDVPCEDVLAFMEGFDYDGRGVSNYHSNPARAHGVQFRREFKIDEHLDWRSDPDRHY